MNDKEFLAAFEAAALTRSEWTHEAHVRMAWLYARREPGILAALAKIRTGIKRLNAALGTDEALYHETVTCAFAAITFVRATLPGAPDTWPAFRDANPELFDTYDPILEPLPARDHRVRRGPSHVRVARPPAAAFQQHRRARAHLPGRCRRALTALLLLTRLPGLLSAVPSRATA